MKLLLFILGFWSLGTTLTAQSNIQWQKALGGGQHEEAYSIQQTLDTGFIIAGFTFSIFGDVPAQLGDGDCLIVKLSVKRAVQWTRAFGGTGYDAARSIQQTTDGGYIMAGVTTSNDGNVTGNHGDHDAWVVKISATGAIQWQKTLGGSGWDEAQSIQQTNDGGYILTGFTDSNNGDVTGQHGNEDLWVVKLDATGGIQWQKTLGGTDSDQGCSILKTVDGGFVLAGSTKSADGDVPDYLTGNKYDYWIIKMTKTGQIEWQKTVGGSENDVASSITQATDGGYIMSGHSYSSNGDVAGNHGDSDFWIVKFNQTGALLWQKSLGGSQQEWTPGIDATIDGGCIVAGSSNSTDGDVSNTQGLRDFWVLKMDDSGDIQWDQTYGGTLNDDAFAIQQTFDGGFVVTGGTNSNNGNVSGNHGATDFWVLKLGGTSVAVDDVSDRPIVAPLEIFPNPAVGLVHLKIISEEPMLNIVISNIMGQQIAAQSISNGGSLDTSSLPGGIYPVIATTASGRIYTGKIEKQ